MNVEINIDVLHVDETSHVWTLLRRPPTLHTLVPWKIVALRAEQ